MDGTAGDGVSAASTFAAESGVHLVGRLRWCGALDRSGRRSRCGYRECSPCSRRRCSGLPSRLSSGSCPKPGGSGGRRAPGGHRPAGRPTSASCGPARDAGLPIRVGWRTHQGMRNLSDSHEASGSGAGRQRQRRPRAGARHPARGRPDPVRRLLRPVVEGGDPGPRRRRRGARAASLRQQPSSARADAVAAVHASLAGHATTCPRPAVTVDTAGLRPGGQVAVQVTCRARLSDLALLGVPGTKTFSARSVEVVDRWRGG